MTAFGPLGPNAFIAAYIFKNQTNKKKSSNTYTHEDFWPLENSAPWNSQILTFSKNPHTRTHTRIFDHWKIHPLKLTNFGIFKKSPHAYTYEDFWPLENSAPEIYKFWRFQKIPTRVHIWGFLTTGKFTHLKLKIHKFTVLL